MNSPFFPPSSSLVSRFAAQQRQDLPDWAHHLFNHWGYGFVLLDGEDAVVIANQAARHALEPLGCRFGEGKGDPFDAGNSAQLAHCIAAARQGKPAMDVVDSATNARFVLAASPIVLDTRERGIALTTEKLLPCDPASLSAYSSLVGLTPAESRVLVRLVHGESPHQAADTLGVGIATVRSHVKAILLKTDCDSLRDLMVRTAKLPAVLGAC